MNNHKIEIKTTETINKSGVARNGNSYAFRVQTAYVFTGKPYPEEIEIRLEDNHPPYEPGHYELSPDSITVGIYKNLQFKPMLLQVKKAA